MTNTTTASAPTTTTTPAKRGPKPKGAKAKGAKKASSKASGDMPLWQQMGWSKPGRKGGKAKAKAKPAKASKALKGSKSKAAAKASPKVKKALARSGTAMADGADVMSLLVAAIKRAVDTGDYENARQILGLLEKQN
jgi:hypothetical protein